MTGPGADTDAVPRGAHRRWYHRGPCTCTGRSMQAAHKGMNITDAQFNAPVEDLQKTLNKFNVPEKEQGELLAALDPMKPQIVGQ
jgi:hemoglobin